VLVVLIGLLIPLGLRADERRDARMSPVVRVFRDASPAVVNLSTTSTITLRTPFGGFPGPLEEIFDFPVMRRREVKAHSVGSGFLIHADGFLVTNAHVVERATEIKVTLMDGTVAPAVVISKDWENDLAILRVEVNEPLHHLRLGRSNDLMPGESVVAIGNPLGLQHTVTTGIISALDRELVFNNQVRYRGLIQTDASINPGNSGGPLLNILGELIGINTAIRGDAQNIGFAIPVDRLRERLPKILDIHRFRRVRFGLDFDDLHSGEKDGGVRISGVEEGSPTGRAGVRPGDVLTAIDNVPTPDFMSAFSILAKAKIDQPLRLTLRRTRGDSEFVEAALTTIPASDSVRLMEDRFGISVRDLTRGDVKRLGLPRAAGLMITKVRPGSHAARSGLRPGDVITSLASWPAVSLEEVSHLLAQIKPGFRIEVQILRIETPEEWERWDIVLKAE